MSEIIKRQIVADDIEFDVNGNSQLVDCPTSTGGIFAGKAINAAHIPVISSTRPAVGGSGNVDAALLNIGARTKTIELWKPNIDADVAQVSSDKAVVVQARSEVIQLKDDTAQLKADVEADKATVVDAAQQVADDSQVAVTARDTAVTASTDIREQLTPLASSLIKMQELQLRQHDVSQSNDLTFAASLIKTQTMIAQLL